MRKLWDRIWNSEPVRFVTALVAAWTAIVAFDQASDEWFIPVWVYVVAIPLVAFLGEIVRAQVTAPASLPEEGDESE